MIKITGFRERKFTLFADDVFGDWLDMTKRILVVDDDVDMLELLQLALEQGGYQVLTVESGEQALNIFSSFKPDLVILDIIMPESDGYQVLTKIREFSNIPVIILTAIQDPTAVAQSLSLGADDYIRKPFSLQEFLARVRAKLRRISSSQEPD